MTNVVAVAQGGLGGLDRGHGRSDGRIANNNNTNRIDT
jgi:hypothetical protein